MNRIKFIAAIATAFLLAFLWLPAVSLLGRGFAEPTNAQQLFSPQLLANTIALSLLTAALSIFFGTPVAFAIARGPHWFRAAGFPLAIAPLAIPPTVAASAFLEITRLPPARAMASLGATQAFPLHPVLLAAPVMALCYFPLIVFPLMAALRALPANQEEAASLAAPPGAVALKVLWPQLAPVILACGGIVAALSMWEMGAPDLLDVRTYSVQIYRDFNANYNIAAAAWHSLPTALLGAAILSPSLRALSKLPLVTAGAHRESATSTKVLLAAALILLLSPISPIVIFLTNLRNTKVLGEVWQANSREIGNSFGMATVASLLMVLVSFVIVILWREFSPGARTKVLWLSVAPMLLAPIALGIALIEFWSRPVFDPIYSNGYAIMTIGYVSRFLPLTLLVLFEAVRRIPREYIDAAYSAGASGKTIHLSITGALTLPTIVGLFGLLWALCASELSVSILVNAPGGQTLPMPIFNLMHIGSLEQVAALSLTLVGMTMAVLALVLSGMRLLNR